MSRPVSWTPLPLARYWRYSGTWSKPQNMTILTTTHDPIVDEYADVIYTLQDGQLVDG